ncbi:radical SAM protein [Candidatus Bathycorpusculum sp.]|uniref:radical SAM protein n=1 Tax=Candidatus Bathycorpusculum sp. TaxID=2994959 RepID=UPI0028302614|nr:radical SAM protein [Candidatus Termitimicrobium sp.]
MVNKALEDSIDKYKKFVPVHLQLSVTNECNMHCSFCSFKHRDKSLQLNYADLKNIIDTFLKLGTKAITITGGGEPFCHPDINELLLYCHEKKIEVGLVTNGTLLNKLEYESAKSIKWCRISLSDDQNDKQIENIETVLNNIVHKMPNTIKWSYSYVVLKNQNPLMQVRAVKFAKKLGFLNVRFVPDQNNVSNIDLDAVKKNMEKNNLLTEKGKSSDLCVFDEKPNTEFPDKCWMYLMRPFVAANGVVYPCCCTQYCSFGERPDSQPIVCHYSEYKQKLDDTEMYKPECNICFFNHHNEWADARLNGVSSLEYCSNRGSKYVSEYKNVLALAEKGEFEDSNFL